eukprot:gene10472-10540_t
MRFEGTSNYVATDDLKVAVNAAVLLRRPLLVKGEPGTGKTVLAHEIAKAVGAPLIEWNVKSTTKAQQGLYEYDAVARLRDGQLGDERVHDIKNYIKKGKLWEAFTAPELPVLLIDEIDKADIEFPNDLLQELDRMSFDVYETQERITAAERPIVVITSNNEKELPDAFLRRCFFHYIKFPDRETMQAIIDVHFPGIQRTLIAKALEVFYEVRDVPGLKKKPSTSELLDWLKLLLNEDMPLDVLQNRDPTKAIPPLHGALLKNEQDIMLFERLAFMARRNGYTGRCACGAVVLEISAKPAMTRQCWCRQCQTIAAGGPTNNAMFPAEAVQITGDLGTATWAAASGNTLTFHFCTGCGTQIYAQSSARMHMKTVPARSGPADRDLDR